MAGFIITGPDGRKATLNVPDGATEEQVRSKLESLKSNWGSAGQPQRSWSGVPGEAVSNIPSSAVQFVKNVTYPIRHPIDTVTGLYDLGYGLASKAHGALGGKQDPQEKAKDEAAANNIGAFFKDRYGSSDGIKKSLATDPIGVAADAAAVLTGGGALAAKGPGLVGKTGQALKATANVVDPLSLASKAMTATGKTVAAAVGSTTGAGSLPIETAYRAGKTGSQVFRDHIRGDAPITEALDMGQDALRSVRKDRGDAYSAGIAGVRSDLTVLDFKPIETAVKDALQTISYKGYSKSAAAAEVYQKIRGMVDHVRTLDPKDFHTAEGLDALKQAVGEVRMATKPGTLENKISSQIYNTIKVQIVKQAPGYAKTMQDYSRASENIDEITKTLSLGERASKDTAVRKLTSVMRNNVNTNYGHRMRLVDEMAKYQPELPNALAGAALNSLAPRGLQSVTATGTGAAGFYAQNPMAIAALPMFSPRLMGEAAYASGRVAGGMSGFKRFVPPTRYRNALYAAGLLSGPDPGPIIEGTAVEVR
jgi:hypothetical protein